MNPGLLHDTGGGNDSFANLRAFIWDPVNGLRDLNYLVDPALGWRLTYAMDINNSGQIVGQGIDADGWTQPFLLTPRS